MVDQATIDVGALEGKPVYSSEGVSVGTVTAVFLDKDTQRPEWLALQRRILGAKRVLVPVADAKVRGDGISVPYSQSQIEGAPETQGDEVSQEAERVLASHYGAVYSEERSDTGLAEGRRERTGGARPRSGEQAADRQGEGQTRDELYAEAKRLGIEGRSKMKKRELALAIERHRGSSRSAGEKANPIEVQKFLEGVDYPLRKADLVREADRQGAGQDVRSTLERIRGESFESPAEVSEAIGRLT